MSGGSPAPTPAGAAVEARALTRRFGSRCAVERLDLRIEAGDSFGLLGANGAGKTTFIRMVTGFLLPSEGSVRVLGRSPVSEPQAVRARLGFVMETTRLYPELRVEGFLRFAAGARGLRGPALRRAVASVIERFELASMARRLVGQLSKGYQQRVSLAQAFVHDPSLVIVDEPTSGLDPLQREQVQDVLGRLSGSCTVLLCTHDLEEARRLTQRVAVLHDGRLVREGPTPDVLGAGDPLALFRGPAAATQDRKGMA